MNLAAEKKFGFVCGCPRSGTTGTIRLLNCHPRIAATNERYAKLVRQKGALQKEHFVTDRFIQFDEKDCGHGGFENEATREGLKKWAAADIVIDKVPHVTHVFREAERLKADFVIVIVREPYGIARSFEARRKRAASGEDLTWNTKNDFARAVDLFNETVRQVRLAMSKTDQERGFPLMVVDYDDLYSTKPVYRELFRFLGVDADEADNPETVTLFIGDEKRDESKVQKYIASRASFGDYRFIVQKIEEPETAPQAYGFKPRLQRILFGSRKGTKRPRYTS